MLEVLPPNISQGIDFYTCEGRSVIHDSLMAIDFSGGWCIPYGRAPTDLYGLMPFGIIQSFLE